MSRQVVLLDIYGSLYYAGAKTLQAHLPDPGGAVEPAVVIRLRGRAMLGATSFAVLSDYAERLDAVGGRLYLSGVDPTTHRRCGATERSRRRATCRCSRPARSSASRASTPIRAAEAWIESLPLTVEPLPRAAFRCAQYGATDMSPFAIIVFLVIGVPLLAFAVWQLLQEGLVRIDSGSVGLLIVRGKASDRILTPGSHFVWPFRHQMIQGYPLREMTYLTADDSGVGRSRLHATPRCRPGSATGPRSPCTTRSASGFAPMRCASHPRQGRPGRAEATWCATRAVV